METPRNQTVTSRDTVLHNKPSMRALAKDTSRCPDDFRPVYFLRRTSKETAKLHYSREKPLLHLAGSLVLICLFPENLGAFHRGSNYQSRTAHVLRFEYIDESRGDPHRVWSEE